MPITIRSDGYFEASYAGPYGGLHVQAPANLIDDKFSPFVRNFMFRNAELRSAPQFSLEIPAPDQGNPPLGLTSFLDVNGTWHTVSFTARGLWQLGPQPNANGPWSPLFGQQLYGTQPVASWPFASVLYYSDGNPLASWDGISLEATQNVASVSAAHASSVISGSTGPLYIGGQYLGELDDHILLLNVTVLDHGTGVVYQFPNRLWYSADGDPTVWDPIANTNAGFVDFLEVPDQFSGLFTVGTSGYMLRSNGVTYFNPTGNGVEPFAFDHLWAARKGIGNVFPWSASSYGSYAAFISTEDVYQMSVFSFQAIGGGTRDAIMTDLANASGNPVATILPLLCNGFTYQTYIISIPLSSFTRNYIYSFEDRNWSVWDAQNAIISGKAEPVWNGILTAIAAPGVIPPASQASSGGGGGASSGGGSGPLRPPSCFTGGTEIETVEGWKAFELCPPHLRIVNDSGVWDADLLIHEVTDEPILILSDACVTPEHIFKSGDSWLRAEKVFPDSPRALFTGKLYNLCVHADRYEDQCYRLRIGHVAHNVQPNKGL